MKNVSILILFFVALIAVTKADETSSATKPEKKNEACEALKGLAEGECMNLNLPHGAEPGKVHDSLAGIKIAIACLKSVSVDEEGEKTFDAEICGKMPEGLPDPDQCCPLAPAFEEAEADEEKTAVKLICAAASCLESEGITIPNVNPDELGLCKGECSLPEEVTEEMKPDFKVVCGIKSCAEDLFFGLLKGTKGLLQGLPHPPSGLDLGGVLGLVLKLVGTLLTAVLGLLHGLLGGALGGLLGGVTGGGGAIGGDLLGSLLGSITSGGGAAGGDLVGSLLGGGGPLKGLTGSLLGGGDPLNGDLLGSVLGGGGGLLGGLLGGGRGGLLGGLLGGGGGGGLLEVLLGGGGGGGLLGGLLGGGNPLRGALPIPA